MSKIIVVFGASGIIGQGFIKTTLEKGIQLSVNFGDLTPHFKFNMPNSCLYPYIPPECSLTELTIELLLLYIDAAGIKVVGVFRSEESAKKVLSRLGNPAEDKFVPIIGNIGKYSFIE